MSREAIDEDFANEFLQLFEKFICSFNGYETLSDIAGPGSQMKGDKLYEMKNVGFNAILGALVWIITTLTVIALQSYHPTRKNTSM